MERADDKDAALEKFKITFQKQRLWNEVLKIEKNADAQLGDVYKRQIKKYENGERALSITNLFKIIDYFKVDANTILNVAEGKKENSIDSRLELMDYSRKAYFQKIFNEMLDNAEMLVS